jgi:phosphohistidine phosphatase SixA
VAGILGVSWRTDDRLASGFDLWDLERLVREAANPARLMIVGHDPDFSALLAELTGAPALPMPKGALARVDIDGPPGAGTGILRWLVPPELLEAD